MTVQRQHVDTAHRVDAASSARVRVERDRVAINEYSIATELRPECLFEALVRLNI